MYDEAAGVTVKMNKGVDDFEYFIGEAFENDAKRIEQEYLVMLRQTLPPFDDEADNSNRDYVATYQVDQGEYVALAWDLLGFNRTIVHISKRIGRSEYLKTLTYMPAGGVDEGDIFYIDVKLFCVPFNQYSLDTTETFLKQCIDQIK